MASAGIYIVEDSFIVSLHLQKTLEGEGYRILGTSDSGEAALADIEQLKPDIVLMDIMLSGSMDGIQAASVVKDVLGIPVIFITALTDRQTIQRAKVTEPFGYLTKPFEDREIFTVIEMALYKSGIERKLRQSEEKFFSTLKSISDGVITIDNSFRVTYANPSAEIMIGSTLRTIQGRDIFDVFKLRNPVTGDFPVNPFQCGISARQANVWPGDFLLESSRGEEIPLMDGTISPIVDSKDQSTGLVLTFKNGTEKLEHNKLEAESERQRLAALIEGQENERTRISKDLHDGLGQMLNAIKMNIRTFITDAQKGKDLFNLLDEAITETNRISENLLPHKLRDFDLITCIQSLCDQYQLGTTAEIQFESFADSYLLSIPEIAKINLYRIAQESVSNAVRHANAKHINVQLFDDVRHIRLTVEDDGKGMNGYAGHKGHGLANMRDRARILKGTCSIESDTSRGTIVIIEIPK